MKTMPTTRRRQAAHVVALVSVVCSLLPAASHAKAESSSSSTTSSSSRCPVEYERLTLDQIRDGRQPYFLGGRRAGGANQNEPDWKVFCAGEDNGPVCRKQEAGKTVQDLVDLLLGAGQVDELLATPCDLWPYVEGRTVLLAGDSHMQEFYKAMVCTLREFVDYGAGPPPPSRQAEFGLFNIARPISSEYSLFGGLKPGSSCVYMQRDSRVCFMRYDRAEEMKEEMHLVRMVVDEGDVTIINFGHQHRPILLNVELLPLLRELAVDNRTFTNLYFRDTTPYHYNTVYGDPPARGSGPPKCAARNLALNPDGTLSFTTVQRNGNGETPAEEMRQYNARNIQSLPMMEGFGIPIIHTFNQMAVLHDYHTEDGGRQDCAHFCWPVPGLWVHSLLETFRKAPPITPADEPAAEEAGGKEQSDSCPVKGCPVNYCPLTMPEIRAGATPYFLGGRNGPKPKYEAWWKEFCAGEANGAVCSLQAPGKTTRDLVRLFFSQGQGRDLLATPCDLWPYVEGRTVLLAGDSQMLDFYKAVVCTLREFVDYEAGPPLPPGEAEYGLFRIARPLGPPELQSKLYSRLPGVPSCVHMMYSSRICFVRFNRVEELDQELDLVRTVVDKDDITIVNFGHHHRPLAIPDEFTPVLRRLKADDQIGTNLFFLDSTPLHYDSVYGDKAPEPEAPYKCRARNLALQIDGSLKFTSKVRNKNGEWPEEAMRRYNARNVNALPVAERFGIPIIHTFNQTVILHDYHRNNGKGHECSHYCWPVQGIWVNAMLKTFRASPPTAIEIKRPPPPLPPPPLQPPQPELAPTSKPGIESLGQPFAHGGLQSGGFHTDKRIVQEQASLQDPAYSASIHPELLPRNAANLPEDPEQHKSCPVEYPRFSLSQIRAGVQPYFLGGRLPGQNPKNDPGWKLLCAGEDFGPFCAKQEAGKTVTDLADLLLGAGQVDELLATPCDLWPYVEGRTVLLAGDSQMLDYYKAMVCTLREFVDYEAGPPLPQGQTTYGLFQIARPIGSDYRAYAHLRGVPSCVHMKAGTRICFMRFNKAEEMEEELDLVRTIVRERDITIVNSEHQNQPGLLPPAKLSSLLSKLVADKRTGTNLYFRDTPAMHFDSLYGDQSEEVKGPFECRARNLELNPDGTLSFTTTKRNQNRETPAEEFKTYNARNIQSLPIAEHFGVPIIHTFNQTAVMHDYHRDSGIAHECFNYCWPVPLLWVYSLLETFRASPPVGLVRPLPKTAPSAMPTKASSAAPVQKKCPVNYSRHTMKQLRAGAQPYFLGGRLAPKPPSGEPDWKQFCAGEDFGPVCFKQEPAKTVEDLVELLLSSGQEDSLLATPCDLWPYVEGRTVLLAGDSQMLDFYKAMVCTLREFVDYDAGPPLPPKEAEYGLFKIARPVGRNHSSYTHLKGVPSCVHMKQGTRVCFIRFNRAKEMEDEIDLLRTIVDKDAITVIHFGLREKPLRAPGKILPLLSKLLTDKHLGTNLYFRDTSPTHYDTKYGDRPPWRTQPPFECKSHDLALNVDGTLLLATSEDESGDERLVRINARNLLLNPIVEYMGIPIINTFNRTAILHDFHRDMGTGHDCSGFCWPVPGLWMYSFLETLRAAPPTGFKSSSQAQPLVAKAVTRQPQNLKGVSWKQLPALTYSAATLDVFGRAVVEELDAAREEAHKNGRIKE